MSTNFPGSIDAFQNPTSTDSMSVVPHATQHADANDAIEALEAKVGANSSAVTTSHDYKLSAVTSTAKALTSGASTQSVEDLTLVTPVLSLGSDATGDMYYRNSGGATARLPIGTSGQILQASSSSIPEWVANPAAADASTTVKGVVEEATQAEIIAGTAAGGTSARLFVNPSTLLTAIPSILGSSANLTLTAGETIAPGDALYLGNYQTGSAITYDNKNIFYDGWSGVSTPFTKSFTVGNNSDRVLIVCFGSDFNTGGVGNITAASYAGVPMTLVQSDGTTIQGGIFYLTNPATGTNNLTYTVTSGSGGANGDVSVHVFSVYNATYSSSQKAVTSKTSINAVFPTYGVALGFGFKGGNPPGTTTKTSTELPNNNQSDDTGRVESFSGCSDIIDVTGSTFLTFQFSGGSVSSYDQIYSISLAPSGSTSSGYARLATASNAFLGGTDRYAKFIGFATSSASATQSVSIKTSGLVTSVTGLTTGGLYYLSNTKGAISTSAGTNSKKIGIAVSTTSLVLKDTV